MHDRAFQLYRRVQRCLCHRRGREATAEPAALAAQPAAAHTVGQLRRAERDDNVPAARLEQGTQTVQPDSKTALGRGEPPEMREALQQKEQEAFCNVQAGLLRPNDAALHAVTKDLLTTRTSESYPVRARAWGEEAGPLRCFSRIR